MEGVGAEVSQKIRSAIKAKLMEIGVYVDEELPDYVMVMVANKRSKIQMDDDLQLFLGKHTSLFTTWLHQVLQKLQEVTVANLGGIKRKSSDDPKKKKKSKQDTGKREPKKKIKTEPEEDCYDKQSSNTKSNDQEEDQVLDEIKQKTEVNKSAEEKESDKIQLKKDDNRKGKTLKRNFSEKNKETKGISKNDKELEESSSDLEKHLKSVDENQQKLGDESNGAARTKSHSTSSQVEDIDDEDFINIRTDGELLDTTEEVNNEDPTKKPKINDVSSKSLISDKKQSRQSPIRRRDKSLEHISVDKDNNKVALSKNSSPIRNLSESNDKLVDARDLLNRKKAAKQSERARSRSRDRSVSPLRKRREEDRENKTYRNERSGGDRKREEKRNSSSHRLSRDNGKDKRDREVYSSRRGDRNESRDIRRRDTSKEPPTKRAMLERPVKNKNDDRASERTSKTESVLQSRKVDIESSTKRNEAGDSRKRTGLVSRVVPRAQEPEDDIDTPVPSVVKVTPRPRRPPSQQPTSSLIIKAISEANKSLASMPQRPDSTQRSRKSPVFTRTLRQRERIPPEKIAVSITNPLALQTVINVGEKRDNDEFSSPKEEMQSNQSPVNVLAEVTSLESDTDAQNEANTNEQTEKLESPQEKRENKTEPEQTPETEPYEEQVEETSDPQFVVTLNGYDPDGLFSQSDLDFECDEEWIKEDIKEQPLLTSTPDEVESPRPKRERNTSPVVIMNSVNHSNLIEVELLKTKNTERCKYWPACRLGDKCTYYHPTKPCKVFPACKYGDACLYIHPQCKFNVLCTRKDCVFAHTPTHNNLQPAAVPKPKAASASLPCKFYPNCTNINCQFAHPARACRFGLYCTKKDCSFDHGQVAPVDKLKWTRVPST